MTRPVAVVTGGANGIGKAASIALNSAGWKVIAADLNKSSLTALNQEFPDIETRVLDVLDEAQIISLSREIESEYGGADALINSAGILQNNVSIDDMDIEDHDRIWDVNYRGTFLASRAFAKGMRTRGKGAIVNIASITALRPLPLFAYGPGKAAVVSLTATLAGHWGPHGVRVNAVAPGYVATEQLMGRVEAGHRKLDDLTQPSALGRMVRPEEIAAAITFLVSDAASAITGITLPVDAGWLAGSAWATYGGVPHGR